MVGVVVAGVVAVVDWIVDVDDVGVVDVDAAVVDVDDGRVVDGVVVVVVVVVVSCPVVVVVGRTVVVVVGRTVVVVVGRTVVVELGELVGIGGGPITEVVLVDVGSGGAEVDGVTRVAVGSVERLVDVEFCLTVVDLTLRPGAMAFLACLGCAGGAITTAEVDDGEKTAETSVPPAPGVSGDGPSIDDGSPLTVVEPSRTAVVVAVAVSTPEPRLFSVARDAAAITATIVPAIARQNQRRSTASMNDAGRMATSPAKAS
ncbi:MAG: hypothetical protein WBM50_15805 [Acidimicrobiales bacterium]